MRPRHVAGSTDGRAEQLSRTIRRQAMAPRSRWRTLLTATVFSTVAVFLGVSGAGITHAFLTSTVTQPGVTLSAGTAAIRVNDSATATLPSRTLSPASPAVWSFTISNTGHAKMDLTALIAAPATPAYAPQTRAILAPVASAAACTAALAGTPAPLNGYTASTATLGTLAAGASQLYCLVVSLPAGTSAAGAGSPLTFTMTVSAAQRAN